MNTPNLDALLADCSDKADSDRMFLFHDHGPALVAVLKQLLRSVNDNQLLEAEAKAEQLLRQLDQEATCQT